MNKQSSHSVPSSSASVSFFVDVRAAYSHFSFNNYKRSRCCAILVLVDCSLCGQLAHLGLSILDPLVDSAFVSSYSERKCQIWSSKIANGSVGTARHRDAMALEILVLAIQLDSRFLWRGISLLSSVFLSCRAIGLGSDCSFDGLDSKPFVYRWPLRNVDVGAILNLAQKRNLIVQNARWRSLNFQ